jgi:hypothetical protein
MTIESLLVCQHPLTIDLGAFGKDASGHRVAGVAAGAAASANLAHGAPPLCRVDGCLVFPSSRKPHTALCFQKSMIPQKPFVYVEQQQTTLERGGTGSRHLLSVDDLISTAEGLDFWELQLLWYVVQAFVFYVSKLAHFGKLENTNFYIVKGHLGSGKNNFTRRAMVGSKK